jgi:hypothetical protein
VLRYAGLCAAQIQKFSTTIMSEPEGMAKGAGLMLEEVVLITLHEELVKLGKLPVAQAAAWDANEMALDGASKESMVKRVKQARAEAYVPKGRWRAR